MKRVLLVEDDADLSIISAVSLKRMGCIVDQAYTCEQALKFLEQNDYEFILLDETLPDMNGSDLCAIIRPRCHCPIIFTSCLSDGDSIINALKSGGDDYMVKPINYSELLARVDAVIRRGKANRELKQPIKRFKSFDLDTIHHCIIRDGEEISLSTIEYTLLCYFIEHAGALLLYQELYQNVWGNDSLGDVRTIMVHVSNLRKKLDPDRIGMITTVRGAGYIFSDV